MGELKDWIGTEGGEPTTPSPTRIKTGRPPLYGPDVKTETCRIPEGYSAYVHWCLLDFPAIIDKFRMDEVDTRNWVAFSRLMDEMSHSLCSQFDPTDDRATGVPRLIQLWREPPLNEFREFPQKRTIPSDGPIP